jgi:anti-anti-sigma regulatory factor
MYCLKTNKKNKNSFSVVFEGNLESATLIQNELEDIFQNKINNAKKIFIDFEDVESINTECYLMLGKLKEKYPIVIHGYSLFIESKLKEYNLI